MVGLSSGDAKTRLVASFALAFLALVTVWLSLRGSALESSPGFRRVRRSARGQPLLCPVHAVE
jgi:hypothetical protein